MIIFDLETTGTNPLEHGIASIGAVAFPDGAEFYAEPRLHDGAAIDPEAMEINGFTADEVRNPDRPELHKVITDFELWAKASSDDIILTGWNAYFDFQFLQIAYDRAGYEWPFKFRNVDLQSIAYFLMHMIEGSTPKYDQVSTVGLNFTLNWLNLPPEPDPHNALTGAQKELEVWQGMIKLVADGGDLPVKLAKRPDCPKCGKRMGLRKPKPDQGWDPFYGCNDYPDCDGTRKYVPPKETGNQGQTSLFS